MTPEIDREVLCEVESICASTLGDANYSVDGVTVNSESHLFVTRSIGSLTNFIKWFNWEIKYGGSFYLLHN